MTNIKVELSIKMTDECGIMLNPKPDAMTTIFLSLGFDPNKE